MSETIAVKERPILFSAPMMRAILEDRKTQTRRVVKAPKQAVPATGWDLAHWQESGEWSTWANEIDCGTIRIYNPYGKIGDLLWVKETFLNNALAGYPAVYFYRADSDNKPQDRKWKPSIFMPREASRIALEITSVRVERVQEISMEDCLDEGIRLPVAEDSRIAIRISGKFLPSDYLKVKPTEATHDQWLVAHYASLWDSINGNWKDNPWVWVITFKRVREFPNQPVCQTP